MSSWSDLGGNQRDSGRKGNQVILPCMADAFLMNDLRSYYFKQLDPGPGAVSLVLMFDETF